jgi:PAS domain S-box-containing protein
MSAPFSATALGEAHDLHRAIVEQGPDAIIFADRDGIIRLWNARAEAVFGSTSNSRSGS